MDTDLIRVSFLQSGGGSRHTGWWMCVYPNGSISLVWSTGERKRCYDSYSLIENKNPRRPASGFDTGQFKVQKPFHRPEYIISGCNAQREVKY